MTCFVDPVSRMPLLVVDTTSMTYATVILLAAFIGIYYTGKRVAYRERDADARRQQMYQAPGTPQSRALYADRPLSRS